MISNIYEKVKKFIKKNHKDLIFYLVLLILLRVFTYPLPYYIYIGGGTIDLANRINLKSDEKGSYNLAYVSQINATIPTYLLSFLIDKWELTSIYNSTLDDEEDRNDIDRREKLYLEEANSNAIINAYKLAGRNINIKSNEYKVIYVSKDSDTDIEVGDTLVSVNDVPIKNNQEYKNYLSTLKLNDNLKVKVIRNNKEKECYAKLKEIDGEKVIGLYLVNVYDYDVEPEISLNFKNNESGPSGGFMLSLAIYDRLVDEDLTKGRKIVGTGTIDISGNIGEIGGVKYKIIGADSKKADIFFVPSENYQEAIDTKKKYNLKVEIVKVETLNEAISYLKENS